MAPRLFGDADRAILEFERLQWRYLGAKDSAIRERFDMSSTRYFRRLNWVIDQPEAVAYDPVTVNRLRRLREARQQLRTHGSAGRETRPDPRGVRPRML